MYFIGIRIFFLVVRTGVNIVEKTIRKEFLFLLPISLLGINLEINAFELLSEGAMGSVSATTDLTIDTDKPNDPSSKDQSTFEQLPFQTSVKVEEYETDDVATVINFEVTSEVEAWANKLRVNTNEQFEIKTIDELPTSSFDLPEKVIQTENTGIEQVSIAGKENAYERGLVNQTASLVKSTENSVTFKVDSYVERAATINANPFQEAHSFGSTYITDLNSSSTITIQAR